MKNTFVAFIALLSLVISSAAAQKQMMMIQGEGVLMLNEVGIILTMKNGKIIVEDVVPANVRPKDAQIVDLQKDDIILMASGKKIASTKDLQELYEKTSIGDELKIGAKRGEHLFIVSFKKEEVKDQPGQKKMVMRFDHKNGEEILPALGLIVGEEKNRVSVKNTLPNIESNFNDFIPQHGDIIISINEKSVKQSSEFVDAYDNIKTGEPVTLTFSRNGKETTVTFSKPKPQQRILIKK